MTPDHQNALSAIERNISAIWTELEGLRLSLGIDHDKIKAAQDNMQDLASNARLACGKDES